MRSTMKTAIILSMLALMCNIDTNAQNTIEGRVTDKETRQPLESATVIIQHTADATVINYTLTDTDGRFRLTVSSPKVSSWVCSIWATKKYSCPSTQLTGWR